MKSGFKNLKFSDARKRGHSFSIELFLTAGLSLQRHIWREIGGLVSPYSF